MVWWRIEQLWITVTVRIHHVYFLINAVQFTEVPVFTTLNIIFWCWKSAETGCLIKTVWHFHSFTHSCTFAPSSQFALVEKISKVAARHAFWDIYKKISTTLRFASFESTSCHQFEPPLPPVHCSVPGTKTRGFQDQENMVEALSKRSRWRY